MIATVIGNLIFFAASTGLSIWMNQQAQARSEKFATAQYNQSLADSQQAQRRSEALSEDMYQRSLLDAKSANASVSEEQNKLMRNQRKEVYAKFGSVYGGKNNGRNY